MAAYNLFTQVLGNDHSQSVVFLPGFAGSHSTWDKEFKNLSRSYRLVLPDLLGFGYSPKPELSYSLDDHLAALHHTLQSPADKAGPALAPAPLHLAGYSMGTILALAYAAKYPGQVASLALVAFPCYKSEEEARQTLAKNSSLFNRLMTLDTPLAHLTCLVMCQIRPLAMLVAPALARQVPAVVARDSLRHTWSSYSRTLRNVIFKSRPAGWLEQVDCPILVVQGKRDRTAPLQNVLEVTAGRPNILVKVVDGDHNLVFTKSREITAEILTFLQKNPRPALLEGSPTPPADGPVEGC
jgi:pimeloyl-ACP methyl ester carboxylesterase